MMKLMAPLLLLLLLAACRQPGIPDDFDYGKVENNIYKNNYFKFEMPVPAAWVLQTKEQMNESRERGQKILEEGNKKLAPALKASEINNAMLLSISRYKSDSVTGKFNHSMTIVAENVSRVPGIKSGSDYLENARKLMKQANLPYETSNTHHLKLDNREFDIMTVTTTTTQGLGLEVMYYTTVIKKFALCIIITYTNNQQEQELKDILQGLRFQ
jgi:hypothetical protein